MTLPRRVVCFLGLSFLSLIFILGHQSFLLQSESEVIAFRCRAFMDVFPIKYDEKCKNICFLNASLQALLANPELKDGILQADHNYQRCKDYGKDDKNCILCRFIEILNNHCIQQANGPKSGETEVDSTSLYFALEDVHKNLVPGPQHDAHEFLVKFFEKLGKCHKGVEKLLKELFGMRYATKVVCDGCNGENSGDEMHSLCTLVEFKETLEETLKCHFRAVPANSRNCNTCNKKCSARQSLVVHHLPKHFFIHVNRFRYEAGPEKITDKAMIVPEVIDGKDLDSKEESISYRLYSFIVHIGISTEGGHYVAYRKSGQNWYRCDDNKPIEEVSVNSKDEVTLPKNETIYLLFYKKCERNTLSSSETSVSIKEDLNCRGGRSNGNVTDAPYREGAGVQHTLENTSLHHSMLDAPVVVKVTENKEFTSTPTSTTSSIVATTNPDSLRQMTASTSGTSVMSSATGTSVSPGNQQSETKHEPTIAPSLSAVPSGTGGETPPSRQRQRSVHCQPKDEGEVESKKHASDEDRKEVFHALRTLQNIGVKHNSGTKYQSVDLPNNKDSVSGHSRPLPQQQSDEEPSVGNNFGASSVPPVASSVPPVASSVPPVASSDIHAKVYPKIQAAEHLQSLTDFFISKYEKDPRAFEQGLKFVLPYGATLVNVLRGCITLVIQATSTESLEELWDRYENGKLNNALQRFLITDEVKTMVNSKDITLDLEIKKDHYERALKELQEVHLKVVPLQNVVKNPALMDELASCLDKQFCVVKYWRHLAYVLGVPTNVSRQFEMYYADLSPTVKLFQYLQVSKSRLTVRELKKELKKDYRNDIVKILEENCQDDGFVADEVTNKTLLLDRIALELDTGVKPVGNWRSLAAKLGLQLSRINHFEMYSNQNPMAMLFSYLNELQKNLRVQKLKEHLTLMGRNDALDVLEKFNVNDDDLVRNVIEPDSELSVKLEEMLNRSIAGVGNWRKLAYKLGVPSSEYNGWDPAATKTRRSPTKLLLEWLRTYKQDLKLDTLAEAMRKIERNDAVKILMRYIPDISKPSEPAVDEAEEAVAGRIPGVNASERANLLRERANPLRSSPQYQTDTQGTPSYTKPTTAEERSALSVSLLPVDLYRKVCMKLDIRRLYYDDYRMLGEKCGISLDFIQNLEQRSEPTKEIIKNWTGQLGKRANVDAFIKILQDIERNDVAELLEEWVRTG